MTTVIAAGVIWGVRSSASTRAALVDHELAVGSHRINAITDSIDKISGNVETMMIRQERQTVMMENMSEDISELKE